MQPRRNNQRNQREPRRQQPFYQQNVRQGDQRPPFVQGQDQMNVPAPFQGPPPPQQQQFVAPQPYQQAPNQHHAFGMQQGQIHPPPQVPMIPQGNYQAPYPADAQAQYQHQQQVPYQVPYQGPHQMQPQGQYQAHPQALYQVPYQAQQQGFNQAPPQYPQHVPQQGAYQVQPQQYHPAAPQVPYQVPYEAQQQVPYQHPPQQGFYPAPLRVIYQAQPYGGFYQPPAYQPNYQYGPPAQQPQPPMIPAQPIPQHQLGGVPYGQGQYEQPPQGQEQYQHPQAQQYQEQDQGIQVPQTIPQQPDEFEMAPEGVPAYEAPQSSETTGEPEEPINDDLKQSSSSGQIPSTGENSGEDVGKDNLGGKEPSRLPKIPEKVPFKNPKQLKSPSAPSTSSKGQENRGKPTGDSMKSTEDGVPIENTRGGIRAKPGRGLPRDRGNGRGRGRGISAVPSVSREKSAPSAPSKGLEQLPQVEDLEKVTKSVAGLSLEDESTSDNKKNQTDSPVVDEIRAPSEAAKSENAVPTPKQDRVTPQLPLSQEVVEPEPAPKVVEKKEKKTKAQKKAEEKAKKAKEEDDFEQLLADAQKENALKQKALDSKKAEARSRLNQYVAVFSLHRNRYLCFRNSVYDLIDDVQYDIARFIKNQNMFAWVPFFNNPDTLMFFKARRVYYSSKKGELARSMIEFYDLMFESANFLIQQDLMWIHSKQEDPVEMERCEKELRRFIFESNLELGPLRPLTLEDAAHIGFKGELTTTTMKTHFMAYLMKHCELRSSTSGEIDKENLTDMEVTFVEKHKLCLTSGKMKQWGAVHSVQFCAERMLKKAESVTDLVASHQWKMLSTVLSSVIEFDLECLSTMIQDQPKDADTLEKQYLTLVFGNV